MDGRPPSPDRCPRSCPRSVVRRQVGATQTSPRGRHRFPSARFHRRSYPPPSCCRTSSARALPTLGGPSLRRSPPRAPSPLPSSSSASLPWWGTRRRWCRTCCASSPARWRCLSRATRAPTIRRRSTPGSRRCRASPRRSTFPTRRPPRSFAGSLGRRPRCSTTPPSCRRPSGWRWRRRTPRPTACRRWRRPSGTGAASMRSSSTATCWFGSRRTGGSSAPSGSP